MTTTEYLKASNNPLVVDAFARMKRGDINYIDAVERIVVQLLKQQEEQEMKTIKFVNGTHISCVNTGSVKSIGRFDK